MKLIGKLDLIQAPRQNQSRAVEQFYISIYPFLLNNMVKTGGLGRFVGFRMNESEQSFYQFFGIETDSIEKIEQGLTGWQLGYDYITVINSNGQKQEFAMKWDWKETRVGEFYADIFGNHNCNNLLNLWEMTTNCYVLKGEKDFDAVEIIDYDPQWKACFEKMKRQIQENLGSKALRIEHYGSTAIAGMPAKPVIDILLEAESFKTARREFIPKLSNECCEYWWYEDHMIFIVREKPSGLRTHHIHIAPKDSKIWEGLIFRDYLCAHPAIAREYAQLKMRLSCQYRNDREQYTRAKTDFIRKVIDDK